jgi:membrane protease YdiL (CAAX protease family)
MFLAIAGAALCFFFFQFSAYAIGTFGRKQLGGDLWLCRGLGNLLGQLAGLILAVLILWKLKICALRSTVKGIPYAIILGRGYLIVFSSLILLQIFLLVLEFYFQLQPSDQNAMKMFKDCLATEPNSFIWFALAAAIGAPLVEEVIFRGLLYSGLRQKFEWLPSALISSAIFAAIHFDPWQFLGLFGLGFAFAWVREKTGSLSAPIILHAANNSFAVLMFMSFPEAV